MSLLFCDSYDNYLDTSQKWTSNGAPNPAQIVRDAFARTGAGSLVMQTSGGPLQAFAQLTQVIAGTAFWPNTGSQALLPVIDFMDLTSSGRQVEIACMADWSIACGGLNGGNFVTLCRSAAGIINPAGYNYIEASVVFGTNATNGSVIVRVNGVVVCSAFNCQTVWTTFANPYCSGIQLRGATNARHDDTYILNAGAMPNNTFLGAVQIYAALPFQDSGTVQWTPSVAGSHYPLVDSIPPNLTEDVASFTPTQIDEYFHAPTGIPGSNAVLAVQHSLMAGLNTSGSRSIASSVNEITGPVQAALSTSPHMLLTPYDVDPVTSSAWLVANIPLRRIGPVVTA